MAEIYDGRLVIVPTPIGNLGDVTMRSLEALCEADAVYCEDTRVTAKLLSAFDVEGAHLERLDENMLEARTPEVLDRIRSGETIAYCTDAGMPGVSDPGLRLVAAARDAGFDVEVLPGPSAAATAYVASGFACTSYYFGGFFPRKDKERMQLLETLRGLDAALVFYESPNRIASALAVIAERYPHREVAVCRELTKIHEEVVRASSAALAKEFADREEAGKIKGEIAIVIGGPSAKELEEAGAVALDVAREMAARLAADGMSQKAIAGELAASCGISRNDAYDIALAAKKE